MCLELVTFNESVNECVVCITCQRRVEVFVTRSPAVPRPSIQLFHIQRIGTDDGGDGIEKRQ